MFDLIFNNDAESVLWNAFGEHARQLDRVAPQGVWHKILWCDLGYPDFFQNLCSAVRTCGEVEEDISAAIMRYERKGNGISGHADKVKYAIKIWHEYSLIGPQLMALVLGETNKHKEEQ